MEDLKKEIKDIENKMQDPSFWNNKEEAQSLVTKLAELKSHLKEKSKDTGAIVSIIAGAGGADAEDFAQILFDMYRKYADKQNWPIEIIHKHLNEKKGIKSIMFEIDDKKSYNRLKNEYGVHRLVRISPFNAQKQRHTSFALVEVIPKIAKMKDIQIPQNDLRIDFSRSSGAGGQNVNKRETAVRVTHIPTGISVRIDRERSQTDNKEKAMQILYCKLLKLMQTKQAKELGQLTDKITKIEWGSQIRSYVLHPYKLVKDHRIDYEESDPINFFDGNIENMLSALEDKVEL